MSKTTKTIITTVALTGVLITTGCSGKFNTRANMDSKMFEKYDDNKDGYVNEAEYLKVSTNKFEKFDDNEDNIVSLKEVQDTRFYKKMPDIINNIFNDYDLDKNEEVSKSEMLKKSKSIFAKTDINHDNKLSKEEMNKYRKNTIFDKIDKNGNNSISRDEFINSKSPFENKESKWNMK